MAINESKMNENKEVFIKLLTEALETREGARTEELVNKLNNSDFFKAPASTKYHNSFEGGLCDHCLNVYYNLRDLVKMKNLEDKISRESIVIVSLLHDLSKMNFYESTVVNKKVYSDAGSKYDELGKFDWVSTRAYKTRDVTERFVYGNHEETAEFMVRSFIPLKLSESVAILYHMGGQGFDSAQTSMSDIYNRYPLAVLLHMADLMSSYIDEG